jgi:hypothetical protein
LTGQAVKEKREPHSDAISNKVQLRSRRRFDFGEFGNKGIKRFKADDVTSGSEFEGVILATNVVHQSKANSELAEVVVQRHRSCPYNKRPHRSHKSKHMVEKEKFGKLSKQKASEAQIESLGTNATNNDEMALTKQK